MGLNWTTDGKMDPRFFTPANVTAAVPAQTTAKEDFTSIYGDDFLDFLSTLREFNCKRLRERKVHGTLPFLTTTSAVVELVFRLCSLLQLPSDVKYLALEVFDRFNVHHFIDLWEYAHGVSTDRETQKKYWLRISSRAQKQALLRAVSSIQIASKFILQSKSVTLKHVQKYLSSCGQTYNLRSVYLSEVRVFSTIGCKVPAYSIYDFVAALLEGLQYWADVHQLHATCENVLSFTFLQRDEIYMHYFWMATNRYDRSSHERLQFAEIELDNFLMASSVVVSSLYIHHLEGLGPNKASETLSELGNVNSNDIRGLAVIIAQMVLGTRTVTFTSCS